MRSIINTLKSLFLPEISINLLKIGRATRAKSIMLINKQKQTNK